MTIDEDEDERIIDVLIISIEGTPIFSSYLLFNDCS